MRIFHDAIRAAETAGTAAAVYVDSNIHTINDAYVSESGEQLLKAIKASDLESAKEYASRLKKASNFAKQVEMGATVLFYANLGKNIPESVIKAAMEINHYNLFSKSYIEKVSPLNKDLQRLSPLDEAIRSRNPKMVKILLEYGANPEQWGYNENESPIQNAWLLTYKNPTEEGFEIYRLLLESLPKKPDEKYIEECINNLRTEAANYQRKKQSWFSIFF